MKRRLLGRNPADTLSDYIHSDEFAARARHPKFPRAFRRKSKLPLPALISALLSMRGQSQQVMLDSFFGALCGDGGLDELITDRGFAKARARLHMPALEHLNQRLVEQADAAGMILRWHGLRVVAADASLLMARDTRLPPHALAGGTEPAPVCPVPAGGGVDLACQRAQ